MNRNPDRFRSNTGSVPVDCGYLSESLPASMLNSALMRDGGFDIFEGLLDETGRRLMLAEALKLAAMGIRSEVQVGDNEEIRGGSPARRFLSAQGGEVQDSFYNAGWM